MSFRILGIDIETTGLLAPDHRIIEVYAGLWDDTGHLDATFEQRFDPERAIAPDAQRVHHISNLDLVGRPKWKEAAPTLHEFMRQGDLIVAHNGDGFDIPFLNQEFGRIGLSLLTQPSFDTFLQGRWATPTGKVPNLGELCFACDEPYDPALAHAAAYDVERLMACFFKGLKWGWFSLPKELSTELPRAA